eukprot:TRINITY_DN5208_c1_g2_i1.p1 TRINITY_DN5208_c1_g2~~TRINITY_DN5208_c1_g2_i1.p1  ORF type:complete len:1324 (-),score=373.41 TRINITY_DN5208_c1_g2_i1:71-3619(-)
MDYFLSQFDISEEDKKQINKYLNLSEQFSSLIDQFCSCSIQSIYQSTKKEILKNLEQINEILKYLDDNEFNQILGTCFAPSLIHIIIFNNYSDRDIFKISFDFKYIKEYTDNLIEEKNISNAIEEDYSDRFILKYIKKDSYFFNKKYVKNSKKWHLHSKYIDTSLSRLLRHLIILSEIKEIQTLIGSIQNKSDLIMINNFFIKHKHNSKMILKIEEKVFSSLIENNEELPEFFQAFVEERDIFEEYMRNVENYSKSSKDINLSLLQSEIEDVWQKYSDSIKKYLTYQEDYYIPILYKRFTRKNLIEIDTKILLQFGKFNEILIPKMMQVARNSQQTAFLQHIMRIIDNLETKININLDVKNKVDEDPLMLQTLYSPLSSVSNQTNNLQLILNKIYNVAQSAQRNITVEEWSDVYSREPQLYSCIFFHKNWSYHYKSNGVVVWIMLFKELQDGSKRIIEYSTKKPEKDILNQIQNFIERVSTFLSFSQKRLKPLLLEKLGWDLFEQWEFALKDLDNLLDVLLEQKTNYLQDQESGNKYSQFFRTFRKYRRVLNVLLISQRRSIIPILMLNLNDHELVELQVEFTEDCKKKSVSLLVEMVAGASSDEKLMFMNNVRNTKYYLNWLNFFNKYLNEYEKIVFNDSVVDISEESVKKRNKMKKEYRAENHYRDSDDDEDTLKNIYDEFPEPTNDSKYENRNMEKKVSAGDTPIMWRTEKRFFLLPLLLRLIDRIVIKTLEKFVDSITRCLKGLRGIEINDVQFYYDYFSKLVGSYQKNHQLISEQIEKQKRIPLNEIPIEMIEKKIIKISLLPKTERREKLTELNRFLSKLYTETHDKMVVIEEKYTQIFLNMNYEDLCSMTKAVLIFHSRNNNYHFLSAISRHLSNQDESKAYYKCITLLSPTEMKKFVDCARLVMKPSQWQVFTSSSPPLSAIAIDKEHWITHPRYPIVALFLKLTHKWIEVELKEIMRLLRRKQRNVTFLINKMLLFFSHLDKHTEIEDCIIQPAIQQKLPFVPKEEWGVEHRVLEAQELGILSALRVTQSVYKNSTQAKTNKFLGRIRRQLISYQTHLFPHLKKEELRYIPHLLYKFSYNELKYMQNCILDSYESLFNEEWLMSLLDVSNNDEKVLLLEFLSKRSSKSVISGDTEEGYVQPTFDSVAEAMKVSQPNLFHHCANIFPELNNTAI